MAAVIFDVVIRTSLIAAATGLILLALRVRMAAARHAAWTVVLVAMLLVPFWSVAGPRIPLTVLPETTVAPGVTPQGVNHVQSIGVERTSASDIRSSLEPVKGSLSNATILGLLFAVYVLGAFVLLARLAIGTVRAQRLLRTAARHEGAKHEGLTSSSRCVAPITVGWLTPVLILPEGWETWPPACLDAVLVHESEHARRRDPLVQWFALLNRALMWFHPLAWWLERRLATLSEYACDAAVMRAGRHTAEEYSNYLIEMAQATSRQGRRLNIAGMSMPGPALLGRLGHIFEEGPMISHSRTRRFSALAFSAAASIVLCVVSLVAAPPESHVVASGTTSLSSQAPPVSGVNTNRPLTATATAGRRILRSERNASTTATSELSALPPTMDFSGQWVLANTASSGPGRSGGDGRLVSIASGAPVNCGLACTMTQDAVRLTIVRTTETSGTMPPDNGSVVLSLDGSASTITQYSGGQFTANAQWDGDRIVVSRSIVPGELDVVQTMARDGNTLTVVVQFTGGSPVTMTYFRR